MRKLSIEILKKFKKGFKVKVIPVKGFPSSRNTPNAEKSESFTKVLQSSRLEDRTDKFYQTLGKQLVDRDASREYLFKHHEGSSR